MCGLSFSQRNGITPESKDIQLESIDDDLRNGIWNVLYSSFFEIIIRQASFSPFPDPQKKFFKLSGMVFSNKE